MDGICCRVGRTLVYYFYRKMCVKMLEETGVEVGIGRIRSRARYLKLLWGKLGAMFVSVVVNFT